MPRKGLPVTPGPGAMKACVVSLVCLLGVVQCDAVEWTAETYPNPQQDPDRCSRTQKSFLCDPDHILSQDDANALDTLTEDVFVETKAPCAYQGYRIAIALVKTIKDMDTPTNTSLSNNAVQARQMLKKLSRTRMFASNVRKAWRLDQCGEDVLITFSVREDVVYTSSGSAAKKKLSDSMVYEISEKARPLFGVGKIFIGLKQMVKDYWAVFEGTYVPVPMVTFSPYVDYVIDSANDGHTLHTAGTSLAVAIVTAAFVT